MSHRIETTDSPTWKRPKSHKKIKALTRKRLYYLKKKQIHPKYKNRKPKLGRRLGYVSKEHRYHKHKKRKLR